MNARAAHAQHQMSPGVSRWPSLKPGIIVNGQMRNASAHHSLELVADARCVEPGSYNIKNGYVQQGSKTTCPNKLGQVVSNQMRLFQVIGKAYSKTFCAGFVTHGDMQMYVKECAPILLKSFYYRSLENIFKICAQRNWIIKEVVS